MYIVLGVILHLLTTTIIGAPSSGSLAEEYFPKECTELHKCAYYFKMCYSVKMSEPKFNSYVDRYYRDFEKSNDRRNEFYRYLLNPYCIRELEVCAKVDGQQKAMTIMQLSVAVSSCDSYTYFMENEHSNVECLPHVDTFKTGAQLYHMMNVMKDTERLYERAMQICLYEFCESESKQ